MTFARVVRNERCVLGLAMMAYKLRLAVRDVTIIQHIFLEKTTERQRATEIVSEILLKQYQLYFSFRTCFLYDVRRAVKCFDMLSWCSHFTTYISSTRGGLFMLCGSKCSTYCTWIYIPTWIPTWPKYCLATTTTRVDPDLSCNSWVEFLTASQHLPDRAA